MIHNEFTSNIIKQMATMLLEGYICQHVPALQRTNRKSKLCLKQHTCSRWNVVSPHLPFSRMFNKVTEKTQNFLCGFFPPTSPFLAAVAPHVEEAC